MRVKDLQAVWRASGRVVGGSGVRGALRRLRFMKIAYNHRTDLNPLLRAEPGTLLDRTITHRPEVLGFVVAPYVCKNWSASDRIRNFIADIELAQSKPGLLDFSPTEQIDLMLIDHLGPDFWLVIDKPVWFHREGIATLNIFKGTVRLFTLAFSLSSYQGQVVALIGGVQGRNIDHALDTYREITKASAGMRPRDLILELFRSVCRSMDIVTILAVSDASRHHRSSFFGKDVLRNTMNYDEIWSERGGQRISDDFYILGTARTERDVETIPVKKRAMYRKRSELLTKLDDQIRDAIPLATAHEINRKD